MSNPAYLRPFFTFFGGKWNLAPSYPHPKYNIIIEPFAGSAGYSLNYYERDIILIEKDPLIAAMWRFLIRSTPDDIYSLPNLQNGESVWDLNIPLGAKSLIGFWCGRGRANPGNFIYGWGRNPKYSRYYWGESPKARIAKQVPFIKHWTLIEASYEDISPDSFDGTWFVDPPYRITGHSYDCGSLDINYSHLAEWCTNLRHQSIVCEGEHANWLPFENLSKVVGNNGRISQEQVWIGPPDPVDPAP